MMHQLILDEVPHDLWLVRRGGEDRLVLEGAEHSIPDLPGATVVVDGDDVHIHLDGRAYHVRYVDPVARFASLGAAKSEDIARAPMPGIVVALHAAPGEVIAAGQTLLVIESMKMETAIKASRAGTVETVHVAPGQSFERDAILVTLAAEAN